LPVKALKVGVADLCWKDKEVASAPARIHLHQLNRQIRLTYEVTDSVTTECGQPEMTHRSHEEQSQQDAVDVCRLATFRNPVANTPNEVHHYESQGSLSRGFPTSVLQRSNKHTLVTTLRL